MRILKYNLNIAFNTLKYIMAYGVTTLQVVPRSQSNKAAKVFNDRDQKAQEVVPECPPNNDTTLQNEVSIDQSHLYDDYVLYTNEVEVPTSAPEPEFEVEVESTEKSCRSVKSRKLRRLGNISQVSSHKISTINRRSRLWVKQMRRRRRRMSFFDGVQRYRLRYPSPKRWNTITTPISPRVDVKILKLLQNKRKQLRRDGLYQFVLWREALKAERNRLLGPRSLHG